jgi:hypothetical protein
VSTAVPPAPTTHATDPRSPDIAPATPSTSSPAASSAEPQYGTVARPVLQPGQEQTAIGYNFTPGTLVEVTLEPAGVDLGTYTAAADGTVTTRFGTTRLRPGTHTIRWTAK